jgi:manganese/zinc/iron transport system permease protein
MDVLPWDITEWLTDPNFRWALAGVVLMSAGASLVGCFTFLRHRALAGDAVSHAILPGICLAYLFFEVKSPFILLIGAFVSGLLGMFCMDWIVKHTKLKTDAATALVLSVFYGAGILLLTAIQRTGNAGQSGLDKFLFGKAASILPEDVLVFGTVSGVLILMVLLFFSPFSVLTFDRQFALARGLPVNRLEALLSVMTVVSIAVGIQAVGVVLMAALLITPAAAARYWTDNLKVMMLLAMAVAVISAVLGTLVSYVVPKMPTGPCIVSFLSLLTVFSVLFGTAHGAFYYWLRKRHHYRKTLTENILKCLYHLGETDGHFLRQRTLNEITDKRSMSARELREGISLLKSRKMVAVFPGPAIALTEGGYQLGRKVTRLHRLWELYLSRVLGMSADRVHEDAEAIEHILTPELEKELSAHLGYPERDPHDEPIP